MLPKKHTAKQNAKSRSASVSKKTTSQKNVGAVVGAAIGETLKPYFTTRAGPKSHPGSLLISGIDLVTQIGITNSTGLPVTYPIATNLFQEELSPTADILDGTRLSRIAQTFDKFLFKRHRWHYDSVVGTSQTGAVIISYDADPLDDTPPATIQGFQNYMAMRDSVQMNVWLSKSLEVKTDPTTVPLFTTPNSPDERFYYQGQIYVATASPFTVSSNSTLSLGNLFLEYEVLLLEPSIEVGLTIMGGLSAGYSVPTTGGPFDRVLTTLADAASVWQQAGKFKFVPGTDVDPDYFNPGELVVQFEAAGEYLLSIAGVAEMVSGATLPSADSLFLYADCNVGPGVTAQSITAPPVVSEEFGFNMPWLVSDTTWGNFGNLIRLFVDPKSAVSDRWFAPILFGQVPAALPAIAASTLNAWWSVMSSQTGFGAFPGTFNPTMLSGQPPSRSRVRRTRQKPELRRSRPGGRW